MLFRSKKSTDGEKGERESSPGRHFFGILVDIGMASILWNILLPALAAGGLLLDVGLKKQESIR